MHFLPSGEVFSGFFIFTPIGKAPNKKATKVSNLPLRLKDFLIFCVLLIIPHYRALSNNLLLILLCEAALPPFAAASILHPLGTAKDESAD